MYATTENAVNLGNVLRVVEEYLRIDDVCTADFLSNIVIQAPREVELHYDSSTNFSPEMSSRSTPDYHRSVTGSAETLVPSGPYFIIGGGIYEAWRMYPDHLDCFEIGIVPEARKGKSFGKYAKYASRHDTSRKR